MLYDKVFFQAREIQNERLELTDKGSLYFFGSNVTFRNCTLVLKVPGRNLIFDQGTSFIDCTFEVKQELKNHQDWVFASIEGCRFKGRLTGCDFGHWPSYSEKAGRGSIQNCDFTEARLDACRIMGSDPSTLLFPKWPCFTLLEPIARADALRSANWPGLVGDVIMNDLHTHPAPTRALTYYTPVLAERLDATAEQLRAVIEKFDGIVY